MGVDYVLVFSLEMVPVCKYVNFVHTTTKFVEVD